MIYVAGPPREVRAKALETYHSESRIYPPAWST